MPASNTSTKVPHRRHSQWKGTRGSRNLLKPVSRPSRLLTHVQTVPQAVWHWYEDPH
ncbi:hypothetical protein HQ590_12925 [bacterium]|nr:hypothetical protein [bacterium]